MKERRRGVVLNLDLDFEKEGKRGNGEDGLQIVGCLLVLLSLFIVRCSPFLAPHARSSVFRP